ncbi:MAG TPA: glycogen phosphorylase, partial [Acholeplasmataceae bacterium]|nr:glycogen phosphorylase [Acholeplasmataceae bacterium]
LHQDESYYKMVATISEQLYPDDSKDEGKTLRLQQQYLFSAAGVQDAIREHKSFGLDLKTLPDHYTFQLNDTHPTVVIPEMMRILMDEEGFGYDEAWDITTRTCAYTNHTILAEALEKWDKVIYRNLLPRIYEIIQEMHRRFNLLVKEDGRFNENEQYLLQLIGSNHLRMANIAIYGSFSVNGVAALHTNILKETELHKFYMLFPDKFNNKTNGVTQRRWLIQVNRELIQSIENKIGTDFKKDLSKIKALENFKDDLEFLKEIKAVKLEKQQQLITYVKEKEGIELIEGGIFDIQIKRLHEYKRQLMNILHIIHIYIELKSNLKFKENYVPHNFIFGAKAAPSYAMAKEIIELINRVANVVNNDKDVSQFLKVVFVTNYNVTYAEKLIPAADISEQISTATKEASGTGNMKFMMNGALTLGTLDGANVEIAQEAGHDNAIIFGLTAEEVTNIYKHNHYQPKAIYDADPRLQRVFDYIRALTPNPQHFDFILSNLLNNDYFLVLKDFDAYVKAHETANEWFKDPISWSKKTLINIANSAFFSSDRTITQYNNDLWKLKEI